MTITKTIVCWYTINSNTSTGSITLLVDCKLPRTPAQKIALRTVLKWQCGYYLLKCAGNHWKLWNVSLLCITLKFLYQFDSSLGLLGSLRLQYLHRVWNLPRASLKSRKLSKSAVQFVPLVLYWPDQYMILLELLSKSMRKYNSTP